MPDSTVTIYLRSVIKDKHHCLAMFDSNRRGDINNLETVVPPGAKVEWVLDWLSGIKEISRIYSKEKLPRILKSPLTGMKASDFSIILPEDLNNVLESYVIEYVLDDKKDTVVTIDPYIRIEPPPAKGTLPNPS